MFTTDEARTKANGITKVFGKDGYDKSRTCQFHFKQTLHRMLAEFPENCMDIKDKGRVWNVDEMIVHYPYFDWI